MKKFAFAASAASLLALAACGGGNEEANVAEASDNVSADLEGEANALGATTETGVDNAVDALGNTGDAALNAAGNAADAVGNAAADVANGADASVNATVNAQ